MINIKFNNRKNISSLDVEVISNNLIRIVGLKTPNISGFQIFDSNNNILGEYNDFTTLYKKEDNGFILSNNETVYEYIEIPYKPIEGSTLKEIKQYKINQLSLECENTIHKGIDVLLSNGIEHFSLTTEDQLNLFGKKAQMESRAFNKFEYHSDGNPCKYYSKEDMDKIIEHSTNFVSYHTTYCNSLFQWVKSLNNEEQIKNIKYGDVIPSEYQSEVLKDYIILMGM